MNVSSVIYCIVGVVFLILGIVMSRYLFPKLIDSKIHEEIDLVEDTFAYKMWKKQSFPLKFKIYFFNVTNADEVQNGGKPIVKEVGPYVYDQYREKIRLSTNESSDVIKYYLKKMFRFNYEDSGGLLPDDTVTIINAAVVGTALQVYILIESMLGTISDAIPYLYPGIKDIFLREKVQDVLFDGITLNCSDPVVDFVCGAIKSALPVTMKIAENDVDVLFSMFGHLNGTEDGPWEMERGLKNTTRGRITMYNYQKNLDIWDTNYCNKINGSDSTVFQTINQNNMHSRLESFIPEFCRSMYASFENETKIFGLESVRYAIDESAFAASEDNACFCPKRNDEAGNIYKECPPSGLMDATACLKAPVLISNPHFYLADKKLFEYVSGLDPNKQKHETYANIEPITATPLSGKRRIQMNIEVKKLPDFKLLENVTHGIFPILWLEEGMDLPENMIEMISSKLSNRTILRMVEWLTIILGALIIIWQLIAFLKRNNMSCFSENATIDVVIDANTVNSTLRNASENSRTNFNNPNQLNYSRNKTVKHQWNPNIWTQQRF